MALFLSTAVNKLDKKGRVSVPAAFRSALTTDTFAGVVAYRSLTLPALEGCTLARLQKLSESLNHHNMFSPGHNDLADCIFAEAQMLNFDSEGRIMIPDGLLAYAGIRDQMAFVGRGPTFQIWEPEAFLFHQEQARQRLRETPVAFNLAQPKEET